MIFLFLWSIIISTLLGGEGHLKKRKKYLLPVIWSSRNHFFMTKLWQNDFSRGRPGPTGSEISIIGLATLRQIFFIFDLNWESLRKRVISEKRLIFTKICFSKVRFFTLPCALLELLLKSKDLRRNCAHF